MKVFDYGGKMHEDTSLVLKLFHVINILFQLIKNWKSFTGLTLGMSKG